LSNSAKTSYENESNSAEDVPAIRRLQMITIAWMCIELLTALVSGIRAHSVALTAFAGDSAVELLSATVVLVRFRFGPANEAKAVRINSILLYTLTAYVVLTSVLSLLSEELRPKPSFIGIGLLVAAATIMPILGYAKKRLAKNTGSGALRADAAQANICAYMSWIALAGLILNATLHFSWADSVAALLLLPLILREANEARRGETCEG
jgi:divalent metal cation (Fe/Co/Zn/Cd) transporter